MVLVLHKLFKGQLRGEIADMERLLVNLFDMTRDVEQKMIDHTNFKKLNAVADNITQLPEDVGPLVVSGRQFIIDGDLYFVPPAGGSLSEKNLAHFFLFNDLLIYSERQQDYWYKFKGKLDMKSATIVTRSQRFSVKPSKSSKPSKPSTPLDKKNHIMIISGSDSITICAADFQDRDNWENYLQSVVQLNNEKKIFGISLLELSVRENQVLNGVPIVLHNLAQAWTDEALKMEGIFRISSGMSEMTACVAALNTGQRMSFEGKSPHLLANIFKTYFRELPEPVLTYNLFDKFMLVDQEKDEPKQVDLLCKLVLQLPPIHWSVLRFLIKFLVKVASFSQYNRMDSRNLGIMFEPIILKKRVIGIGDSLVYEPQIVKLFIDNLQVIFTGH